METNNSISDAQLHKIKDQISKETNPKNATETFALLTDGKLLQQKMQNASVNFEKQVGRSMTYSEMREMMG